MKKNTLLFIHAPDREHTQFFLVRGSTIVAKKKLLFKDPKRADLLKHIHALLMRGTITPQNLSGVVVLSGPGQFSFLRAGIIIANSFAWALHIPVVGVYGDQGMTREQFIAQGLKKLSQSKSAFRAVVPEYGKEPNITKPRSLSFPRRQHASAQRRASCLRAGESSKKI